MGRTRFSLILATTVLIDILGIVNVFLGYFRCLISMIRFAFMKHLIPFCLRLRIHLDTGTFFFTVYWSITLKPSSTIRNRVLIQRQIKSVAMIFITPLFSKCYCNGSFLAILPELVQKLVNILWSIFQPMQQVTLGQY